MRRRQFVRTLAQAWAATFLTGLIRPSILRASPPLPPSGAELRQYVQFNLYGAPSRWQFDLPLQPDPAGGRNPHPYVGTELSAGSEGLAPVYRTFDYRAAGVALSSFWENSGVTADGVSRPFHSLLPNMLTIRGCDMKTNSHIQNNRRLAAPVSDGESLTALIAEKSSAPFPYVGYRSREGGNGVAPDAFHSSLGVAGINLPFGMRDPVAALVGDGVALESDEDERLISGMIDEVAAALGADYPYAGKINGERKRAQRVSRETAELLKAEFAVLYRKYLALFRSNLRLPLRGNDDRRLRAKDVDPRIGWSLLNYDRRIVVNEDLRDCFLKADFSEMATQFAFLECMLKHEMLSSSVVVLNPLRGLELQSRVSRDGPRMGFDPREPVRTLKAKMPTFDSHHLGGVLNHLFCVKFYQVFAVGLLELRASLGEAAFGGTLLHIASEFDREPQDQCDGSDHGYNGSTQTFLSGSIASYQLYGDILTSSERTESIHRSRATWGHGAKMAALGGRETGYGNVASTICGLFGVRTLTPNNPPLAHFSGGKIALTYPGARNLDHG